jgi:hypothetical protein
MKTYHTLHFTFKHFEDVVYDVYMHNLRLCTLDVEDRVVKFVDNSSVPLSFFKELENAAEHLSQFVEAE